MTFFSWSRTFSFTASAVRWSLSVPFALATSTAGRISFRRLARLGVGSSGDVAAPSTDDLAKYFESRKILFRAPEYRKATLLFLSPADLAKPEAISDADAKAAYAARKDTFGTPEKRELRQIVFAKPEEAAAASERVTKGLSFADLAKERGMKDGDTDVGTVAKADIIDPAVADAAFALKAGETSAPVKGTFGTVLLQPGLALPARGAGVILANSWRRWRWRGARARAIA